MKRVRGWDFDAVIGIGGIGQEPQRDGIAGKLTWVGIGPHKRKKAGVQHPLVTFDHFLYYGEKGPLLKTVAPALARRMYDGNVRILKNSLSDEERLEVEKILDIAKGAPPSGQLEGTLQPDSKKTTSKCRK